MAFQDSDDEADVESANVDHGPDLVQMIQLHALRLEPVKLTVESAAKQLGWLHLDKGDVIRASTAGGKQGFRAFVEMVSWELPRVVQLDREVTDLPNVDLPLPKLLLEAFWEAEAHISDDPSQELIPEGLEEDTVSGKYDIEAPDGVTKVVIETARRLSKIKGFVAVTLLCSGSGEAIETLGDKTRLRVPDWVSCMVATQRDVPDLEHVVVTTGEYIDILVRPVTESDVAFLLRMERATTNRGLLEVGLRHVREQGMSEIA